jgi:hypothetical protein
VTACCFVDGNESFGGKIASIFRTTFKTLLVKFTALGENPGVGQRKCDFNLLFLLSDHRLKSSVARVENTSKR